MRTTVFSLAALAELAPSVRAQAAQSAHGVAFNATVTSDYRCRGVVDSRRSGYLDLGANASETAYASPANGKFLGKKALVASVGKTF